MRKSHLHERTWDEGRAESSLKSQPNTHTMSTPATSRRTKTVKLIEARRLDCLNRRKNPEARYDAFESLVYDSGKAGEKVAASLVTTLLADPKFDDASLLVFAERAGHYGDRPAGLAVARRIADKAAGDEDSRCMAIQTIEDLGEPKEAVARMKTFFKEFAGCHTTLWEAAHFLKDAGATAELRAGLSAIARDPGRPVLVRYHALEALKKWKFKAEVATVEKEVAADEATAKKLEFVGTGPGHLLVVLLGENAAFNSTEA
jgi:hypothetical protein